MNDPSSDLQRDLRGAAHSEYLVLAGLIAVVLFGMAGQLGASAPAAFTRLCLRMLGVE